MPEQANGEQRLAGGSFYGAVANRQGVAGAIFTELQHSCARTLPAHSHAMPFFCLFLGGDYGEQYGRRYMQLRPFTLTFRPAEVPHRDEVGPRGARMFGIEVDREWQDLVQSASGNLQIAYDTEGGEKLWLAVRLYRETRSAVNGPDLQIQSLVAELLAHTACKSDHSRGTPDWLRRVKDKLRCEFCDPLSLAEVANDAGVHPVHLSRAFRRFTGHTLGEYLQRLRVRQACELMMDPELSLADISCMTKFADQSHFTRTCKVITGVTPGEIRKMVREARLTSAATLCPVPS